MCDRVVDFVNVWIPGIARAEKEEKKDEETLALQKKPQGKKLTRILNKAEEQELAQVSSKTAIEHNIAL